MAQKGNKAGGEVSGVTFDGPSTSTATSSGALKKKQKQSIVDEINQPDPIGDFVRRVTGANKEKKKTGF